MKLTEKQKRFADYYIETANITESAVRAGYSRKYANAQGYKLLDNVGISTYISERMSEKDKERIASQDEILETLTKVLRGEESGTELVGVGKGAQTVEQLPPSIEAKIRAAELLGKRYALWKDKQEVDVTGMVQFVDDIGEDNET